MSPENGRAGPRLARRASGTEESRLSARLSSVSSVDFIDPLRDDSYAELVASAGDAEIFHDPLWLELLRDEYGYEIGACAVRDGGRMVAAIPYAKIASLLTGKRLVALPFSDHCPALTDGDDAGEALALLGEALAAHAREARLDLAIHAALPSVTDAHVSERYVRHVLTLPSDPDEAEKGMAKTFRQKARQARRGGLEVERRTDAEALEIFFRLHLETRHRLGVPTQPKSFIARFEKLFAAGRGCVWVVDDGEGPICAAIFLTQGRTVTYKYSASSGAKLNKRPNNLLLLEAIRFYAENRFERIELGRTDIDADGLRQFKRSTGAEELPLSYTYLSEPAPLGAPSLKEKVMTATIQRSPAVVGRLAGEVLYRHVG